MQLNFGKGVHCLPHFYYCSVSKWILQFHSDLLFALAPKWFIIITIFFTMKILNDQLSVSAAPSSHPEKWVNCMWFLFWSGLRSRSSSAFPTSSWSQRWTCVRRWSWTSPTPSWRPPVVSLPLEIWLLFALKTSQDILLIIFPIHIVSWSGLHFWHVIFCLAQPKTDKWISSQSHFSLFNCCLSVIL